jgi:glycine/D-amino acid oxidase-like deaminating enzyme
MMLRDSAAVLVLGAGLQGSGVALELARRGTPVVLVDRDPRPMNRASLRNEGKIHLGFIYANDGGFATARLQIEGALRFRSVVGGWLGSDDRWMRRSRPFHYVVARDSLLDADRLARHYAAVEQHCLRRLAAEPGLDYLGVRPRRLVRRLRPDEMARHFEPDGLQAGFATAERALDTATLARAVRGALRRAGVDFRGGWRARTATREDGGFRVEGDSPAGAWRIRATQVVNATWEGRAALDRQVGLEPTAGILHRLKFRVTGALAPTPLDAPSASMVLGRYGDVVVHEDGEGFLSWYPVGLRGWSEDPVPPAWWEPACRGEVERGERRAIAAAILAGIRAWYPGIRLGGPPRVDAGAIVACGRTDVDDPASGLHERVRIGVTSRAGWHSVDTGKLTTAPLFAVEVAARVAAEARAERTPL